MIQNVDGISLSLSLSSALNPCPYVRGICLYLLYLFGLIVNFKPNGWKEPAAAGKK